MLQITSLQYFQPPHPTRSQLMDRSWRWRYGKDYFREGEYPNFSVSESKIACWSMSSLSAIWLVNSRRSTLVRHFQPSSGIWSTLACDLQSTFWLCVCSPSHAWCRSSPSPVYNQFWHDLLQRLGYCWTREVRWFARWLLYSGPMRYHYVRCHIAHHLQKRSQLAPWSWARLRKHPHCFMWKQGRCQGEEIIYIRS